MASTTMVTAQTLAASLQNPLQSLTFIAAPALLTNSCALLLLSTSNRFARAVDRARLLAKQPLDDSGAALTRVERRALLLVRALIALYTAVGSFGASTFLGLLGSVGFTVGALKGLTLFTEGSLVMASIGVLSIATAAAHLVPETITAYRGLLIEATTVSKGRILEVKEI
jgi:hypothetical protein